MNDNQVLGVDHVSFLTRDAARSTRFYQNLFQARLLARPALGFSGAWLDLGGSVILHLLELPDPDGAAARPAHGGRDRHIALAVRSTAGFADKLAELDVAYTRSKSGRDALFFRDPDGNAIELTGSA